jgi:Sulfotransferase domain
MPVSPSSWLLGSLLVLLSVAAATGLAFFRWYRRETEGDAYFARSSAERLAFKAKLRRRSRWILATVSLAARIRPPRKLPGTSCRGVALPPQCGRGHAKRAIAYRPQPADVFVATQMKCGTTWMQQVVYEVLSRGRGDLGDEGHRHLYALSPWLESSYGVPLERAPRIGDAGRRIVKTHFGADLCPLSDEARYVYVTRHPVACFASCVDFIRMLAGPRTPRLPDLLGWFCSDAMWWGAWPGHVEGWWREAQQRPNVLFVHYEEMLADLPGTVDRVAALLETELLPEPRAAVVRKAGFDFMKTNEERFEMAPPTPFAMEGSFLRSGRADRQSDLGPAERERILAFCRERLRGAAYPAARFYPDLAEPAA